MSLGEQVDGLLARMRFMAEANAAALDADKISSGKSDSKPPPFNGKALVTEGEQLVKQAISELGRLIGRVERSQVGELTAEQLKYWVLVANEGRSVRDVAERLGIPEGTVYAIRERANVSVMTGRVKKSTQGRKPAGFKEAGVGHG